MPLAASHVTYHTEESTYSLTGTGQERLQVLAPLQALAKQRAEQLRGQEETESAQTDLERSSIPMSSSAPFSTRRRAGSDHHRHCLGIVACTPYCPKWLQLSWSSMVGRYYDGHFYRCNQHDFCVAALSLRQRLAFDIRN
jgi:hypothetical protein